LKKKIVLMAILSIVLILAMFNACPGVEAQTPENKVTLSGSKTTYYGVFVNGPGEGEKKAEQETVFKNDVDRWMTTLKDKGQGWDESRMTPCEKPTFEGLKKTIAAYENRVQSGEEFHFFFDGHGSEDGSILLGDGCVTPKQLSEALSGFKECVTISVIFDSCYSYLTIDSLAHNNPIKVKDKDGNLIPIDKTKFAAKASTNELFPTSSFTYGTSGESEFTWWLIFEFSFLRSPPRSDPVTAKELFHLMVGAVVNATIGDQDGDRRIDEDGGILGDYYLANCTLGVDDDLDGLIDEDPPIQQPSYIAEEGEEGDFGGIVVPVNKLVLLAPYIGFASTIIVAAVATAIYVKRVKRRKEKQ